MKAKSMDKYLRSVDKSNKIIIPKEIRDKRKDNFLEVKIETDDKEKCFITSVNRKVTIRKQVREQLDIQGGDVIAAQFRELERVERTDELFKNGKVDLLSLIPEKTTKGYEILVTEFEKDSESFLRVWSKAGRKGSQIEINRFAKPKSFGKLLGQYQAEGQKSRKVARVEFTNKLIDEHNEFVQSLGAVGIDDRLIHFYCNYNDKLTTRKEVISQCKSFEDLLGRELRKVISHKSKGPIHFRTRVQNMIFTEILLNSMSVIRKNISSGINSKNRVIAQSFLAKLLTGDGTFDATISPAREYEYPSINIKIVDQDLDALQDYKDILSNFGFNSQVNKERIWARSSCSLDNILFLYEIEAFKNTKNWQQMAVAVMLILRGRRYRTYKRFIDFLDTEERISSGFVMENYGVSRKAAQEWLNNKCGEGLLKVCRESPYPKLYGLTNEGIEFAELLERVCKLAKDIKKEKEVKDYEKALEALKGDIRP